MESTDEIVDKNTTKYPIWTRKRKWTETQDLWDNNKRPKMCVINLRQKGECKTNCRSNSWTEFYVFAEKQSAAEQTPNKVKPKEIHAKTHHNQTSEKNWQRKVLKPDGEKNYLQRHDSNNRGFFMRNQEGPKKA